MFVQPNSPHRSPRLGMTLLELTLVVLVIAIMAAIVMPEFMNTGRGRSVVSRVKSDQRSLATAIEAYYVDNNAYPAMASGSEGVNAAADRKSGAYRICTFRPRGATSLNTLTTPICYVSSYFSDALASTRDSTFGYRQYMYSWVLISYGPDRDENDKTNPGDHNNTICVAAVGEDGLDENFETAFNLSVGQPTPAYLAGVSNLTGNALTYDPTNGTASEGDIVRVKQ